MKAAFALLGDSTTHNVVRNLTWQMYRRYGISLSACRIPPHISLKQPFDIPDVTMLEPLMAEIVHATPPFNITLTHLQLIEIAGDDEPTGLLWLGVEETAVLRRLHDTVNQELTTRFENTEAPFDGPDYQFHITVATGGLPLERYQEVYREFRDVVVNLQCRVQELVLFVYDQRLDCEWDYITYKILPFSPV